MLKLNYLYLPLILWALHQLLGTARGDVVYGELSLLITQQPQPAPTAVPVASAAPPVAG